ncbi:DNA polymerase III subunit gamma/tau [Shewanella psychrotolerans]|uniref:DNA polymerase III subunit gamma/tau n=1 Tax=Shewanella psychrotolerans TaxID=2864206 RepID=UPI001C6575B2|nr:DNA polymerase III subunit gamma/tau [Shewanella psychrotolerans]QYK02901.1 DNA polymerase III subunit gamma/tau [Shewanella psychrotolerans]
MSYQVLARKWRPATFEQVVGQSHVLHALTNALMQNRLHHAYLFSGTRGVGKTSLARLFAKGLNCEQGITASPCGECASCVEIAQGRFVDLIEVDAASRTKVDDTRELLDNVQYRPSRGRFKVYLIDEVHMLSRSSFNALLKTLEEPPEHVKFLLATTDPQRLPVTVLSRCLQFNLKSLTLDEICLQLANILGHEAISFDDGAIKLLAKAANGSMRDALSLADQAIAFGAGQVTLSQVQTMLGTIDEHYVIVLLNALCDGDVANLMQVTDEVLSFGADPFEVLRSLLELLHQITLTQFAPAAAQLSKYTEQIKAFASQLRPEQVQLYYQLLLTGRKDLPHAPDPKSGLEMALLRAVAFVPEAPIKQWQGEPSSGVTLPEINAGVGKSVSDNDTGLNNKTAVIAQPSEVELKAEASVPHSTKLDEVGESEESTDTDALIAEQALILSQAASQGMNQVADSDSDSDSDASVAADSNSTGIDATQNKTSSKPEVSQSDAAEADLFQQGMFEQSMTDDVYIYDGELDEQDPSDYEAYLASQAEDTNTTLTVSPAKALAGSSTVDSATEVATDEAVPVEDDLLDAVLAARQFLLTDLDETSSKESDTKKPEVGRQAYVPPKRSTDVNNKHNESAQAQEQIPQGGEAADDSDGSHPVTSLTAESLDDRPPWEAPAETAPVAEQYVDEGQLPQNVSPQAGNDSVTEADETESEPEPEPIEYQQLTSSTDVVAVDTSVSAARDESWHSEVISHEVTGDSTDLKWYRLMSALDIGGRVRQLAVNSVCRQFVDPLPLVLKPNQKHLESPGPVAQLEEALGKALGAPCQVVFSVGVEQGRETPLEVRQRFHKELLVQAHQGLINDDNIRWLTQTMNVEMDPDSLSYSPELLGKRGHVIELIDKSNFIEQVES